MESSEEVLIRKVGKAGRITLNRPGALNALTYDMCLAIDHALVQWLQNDSVELVLIDATGSKAFCAGGDIAEMYRSGLKADYSYGRKFWADEYRMNARISNYPKPFVAIMDGIVMGGGVGVSAHGSDRIVTENTLFAMPECGIGLVPDVGGNHLLAQCPGRIGEYLSATGSRLGAADCIFAGIADYFVPENKIPNIIEALEESGDTKSIDEFSSEPPQATLPDIITQIEDCFSKTDAIEILNSIEQGDDDWSKSCAKLVRRSCPLAVASAVELVRHARSVETIEDVLKSEYRFTWRSMEHGNFIEGIRAQIIDKDRNPAWVPATLEELVFEKVEMMLSSLGENELAF